MDPFHCCGWPASRTEPLVYLHPRGMARSAHHPPPSLPSLLLAPGQLLRAATGVSRLTLLLVDAKGQSPGGVKQNGVLPGRRKTGRDDDIRSTGDRQVGGGRPRCPGTPLGAFRRLHTRQESHLTGLRKWPCSTHSGRGALIRHEEIY